MKTHIRFLGLTLACLLSPSVANAQLSLEEYNQFNKLLTESDDKSALAKRLKLIADAFEREADPKLRLKFSYPVDLKRARIPAKEGIPFLLERLELPSDEVKRHVVRMLGAYGEEAKSTTPALLKLLKEDRLLRMETVSALARIDPANGEAAAAILERLGAANVDDQETRIVLQSLVLMAAGVPKSALPQLAKFLEHRQTEFAVYAYELIGKVHAVKQPTLDEIRAMESIDWQKTPDQGYAILSTIGSAGGKADFAAALLVSALDSMPPAYLESALLDTLGKIRTDVPKAIEAARDRLAAKDNFVRFKARATLAQFDPKKPAVIRTIALGLKHEDLNIRLGVASTLRSWDESGRIPPDAHAEMLEPLLEAVNALDDNPPASHLDAYLLLFRRFGKKASPASEKLAKLVVSEAYFKKQGFFGATLRGRVLATLANIGTPDSVKPQIQQILEKGAAMTIDGGFEFAAAARAASNFPEWKEVVPLLMSGLKTKGPEKALYFIDWSGEQMSKPTTVRLEVIRALAKFERDAADALPLLKEIAASKEAGPPNLTFPVRQEARRAYLVISGEALPPEKGVFANGITEQLHVDERLQVKVTLKMRNARPQDVLKRLEQATNLKFTMDENVDMDVPAWSSMHMVGMPSYNAMRALAAAQSVQGKWEDTGDGYRLIGKLKSPDQKLKNKLVFPPFRDDSFDPMPEDPRLQKAVTIQMTNATLPDILKKISDETKVPLSAEKVDMETPLFGSINWPNGAAWLVLRNIAELPRVNGNWEKAGDGYRLRGTFVAPPIVVKTAPIPVSPRPGAPVAVTNESASKPRTSLFIAGGVIFAIFLGAGLLLMVKLLLMRGQSSSTLPQ